MNKEIICPNCSQRIKILDTIGYDLYLENLKKEEREIDRLKEEYVILQNASDEVEEEKDKEIERQKEIIKQLDIKNLELTTTLKEVRECINHYAIENEDYSKIYNNEEKELLEILDKESK